MFRIVYDERGSVRLVVQVTTGNVRNRIDYTAWGTPSLPIAGSIPFDFPFGFAGGIFMPDTGFWHFGARDYDPVTGRWTTKDPILFGGGYNLYMYAGNDPVNWVDPNGAWPLPANPAGIGDPWMHDPEHGGPGNPSGTELWRHPSGWSVEWHPEGHWHAYPPGSSPRRDDRYRHRTSEDEECGRRGNDHLSP